MDFVMAGVEGGSYITTLGKAGRPDMNRIPVNPYLFNDDNAGRRLYLMNEITIGEDFKGFEFRTELPSLNTMADLYQDFRHYCGLQLKETEQIVCCNWATFPHVQSWRMQ